MRVTTSFAADGFSDEQKRVLESDAKQITLRASAGSGKTRVLVGCYMRRVLVDGFRPDQILTITFTRKAAAEMKQRIVRSLREMGRPEDARIAETGPIQTIHGFCERTLRENALSARIDPRFEVLDESDSALLRNLAIEEVLGSDMDDCPLGAAYVREVAGEYVSGGSDSLHAKCRKHVNTVMSAFRGSGITPEMLEDGHRDAETYLQRIAALYLASKSERERAEFASLSPIELANRSKPRKPDAAVRADETGFAEYSCGLAQVAARVWRAYDARLREMCRMDFGMLESLAVDLVENDPSVRERLRRQYRTVLVDELQDVNPMQYRLLEALGIDLEMMVGDPQQSIYRFRQADVKLYWQRLAQTTQHELSRNYRSDEGILQFVDYLFRNVWQSEYRPMSAKALARLDLDDTSGPDYTGVEIWPQQTYSPGDQAEKIAQLVREGIEPREIAVLCRVNREVQAIHEQLVKLGISARIHGSTSKFHSRVEVRDVAHALYAVSDPSKDASLLALLQSPAVGLSMDCLVLMSELRPLFPALTDFEPPSDEDCEKLDEFLGWFEDLSSRADRMAAWEVLAEIYRVTPILRAAAASYRAKQSLANLRKLQTMAASKPELSATEFAELIEDVEKLRSRESDAPSLDLSENSVTLMTVHKAKGLEFDVVVVGGNFAGKQSFGIEVLAEPRLNLVGGRSNVSEYRKWLAKQIEELEKQEAWRVLYVSMTRAKKRLCLVNQKQKFGAEIARHLGIAKGEVLPGVFIRE